MSRQRSCCGDCRRAIELSPGYASAHHWLGAMLTFVFRRFDEGAAELEIAHQLDPYSPVIQCEVGLALGLLSELNKRLVERALEGESRPSLSSGGAVPMVSNLAASQATEVADRARSELSGLGIVVDFFQIQDLSDESGYLEAIGRKRNAEVQRDAAIAEARAETEARQVAAEQRRLGREAEITAENEIIARENALEVERATLKGFENAASEKAEMAGAIARVESEIGLQDGRTRLAERQQEADIVIPARAEAVAARLAAEGHAARIVEEGKAIAEAVEQMRNQWDSGNAHELFMIRMFPELVDKVTSVVGDNLRIDKLTILDGGGDQGGVGLPSYVRNLTSSIVVMLEEMKNATGVDLARIAARGDDRSLGSVPPEL